MPALQQPPNDPTFRAYTPTDGERYAQARQRYSTALYETLVAHHTATGGKLGTVVDVGCGPGIATYKLAETFTTTIGLDPSAGMIAAARTLAATTKPSSVVRFELSTAEDISAELIPDGSVDLITAATCAHWFDLPSFYKTATRLLRPNGTLALWTSRAASVHPSTPAADTINTALRAIETAELLPFFMTGNLLTRDLYTTLPLPWTIDPPVPALPADAFRRVTFGFAEDDGEDAGPFFEEGGGGADGGEKWLDMDTVERMIATASPVARWREANPGKVGTEEDVVRRMRRTVEKLLREAGVEEGKERVRGSMAGVLLMFKKQA